MIVYKRPEPLSRMLFSPEFLLNGPCLYTLLHILLHSCCLSHRFKSFRLSKCVFDYDLDIHCYRCALPLSWHKRLNFSLASLWCLLSSLWMISQRTHHPIERVSIRTALFMVMKADIGLLYGIFRIKIWM